MSQPWHEESVNAVLPFGDYRWLTLFKDTV